MRRRLLAAVLLVPLVVFPADLTLARFTDADASTGTFGSDTLDPPSGLSASGGTSVTLAWTATPDTYAAGYNIYRAATSGGTYSLVGTVTPRSKVTATDSPGVGTFWYKVRAFFQGWESVSPPAESATVIASQVSTTFAACVSQAAVTANAGNNNGYESNPARACVDDSSFAVDANSGTGGTASCGTGSTPDTAKDQHLFWGFATGLPGSVGSIDGLRVRADLSLSNNGGTTNLCAQLSWDGGTTWTAIASQAIPNSSEATYTFGSTSDTWGRTWTPSQLDTTNLRVRIINAASQGAKDFRLDYIAVSVTYTP